MIDLAAISSRLAHICFGKGQNGCVLRIAAVCAVVMAVVMGVVGWEWDGVAYADGGANAREREAEGESGGLIQGYARGVLRALADDGGNEWVRYWRARADCDAAADYARRGDGLPIDRVLLTLTSVICARMDARLGVNPADYAPRGEERGEGLMASEPGAAVGYTLFALRSDTNKVYLIDPLGRAAHIWHIEANPPSRVTVHAKLLDNGNLMAMTKRPSAILEIDPRGNILWQYNNIQVHHDFLKMPNGNVMLLVHGRKSRDEAIAAGANPEFVSENGITYDYLVEVRPTGALGGEVVWGWSVWDHLIQDFDPSKPNYGDVAEHPELIDINFLLEPISKTHIFGGWTHTNAIDYNSDLDQIMLSPRHFSELWVIDHSTDTEEARGHSGGNSGMGGDLLYRWGNPRAYGHGDVDDQRLFWQHNTHWIAPGLPGEGNILLFNNGREFEGHKRFYSSIDEIVPPVDGYRYRRGDDAAYPPGKPAWTYTAEPTSDFFAPIISGTQRLPNGNTLIADGTGGTIFQATPDGKVVWKYIVPKHYHISLWQREGAPPRPTYGMPGNPSPVIKNEVYRAYFYPPDHPGLQALDLAPGAYIENDPDLLDWARASVVAGDFGQPLALSRYDIYLDENVLIYFKQPCADEDAQPKFFLQIIPADARDLPADKQERGFVNKDFWFGDRGRANEGWCVAIAPLPRYSIHSIHTGQFTQAGRLWQTEINLNK